MIKYLGSKRKLLSEILNAVQAAMPGARSVIDLFSGTSRVGYAFKKKNYEVHANDHNLYAYLLAKCYIATNLEAVEKKAKRLIAEFNAIKGQAGYFTENFCVGSFFFHPKNGEKIDAIRESIAQKKLEPSLEAVLLVSLMEAADRVDSTCGIQMAYLKKWAPRAQNDLSLRMPLLLSRKESLPGFAYQLDALEAATTLEADITYLDPPYNQHSYRGNYHIWETLMRWDKPEVYGVAAKRIDCRTHKSLFNSKRQFINAFASVVSSLKSKVLIVSFNNEGFVDRTEMEALLSQKGQVKTQAIDYKRYVGAQIGIHNPKGEAVGQVSHLYNKEYLYTVDGR
jgi:adenine-specific DNA-methyltransferase